MWDYGIIRGERERKANLNEQGKRRQRKREMRMKEAKEMAKGREGEKVHILGFNKIREGKGVTTLEGRPPKDLEIPEGKIWHMVLQKVVPEDWAEKEMSVDRGETILGAKGKWKEPDGEGGNGISVKEENKGNKEQEEQEMIDKTGKEGKGAVKSPNEEIAEMVQGMSPGLGKFVLAEYEGMPVEVKGALEEVYAELGEVKGSESIGLIEGALGRLEKACEANPDYKGVYYGAKEDANEVMREKLAKGGLFG